jgi:hypothetical protein
VGGEGRRTFRHEISLLGEVACEAGGAWDRARFDRLMELTGCAAPPDRQPLLADAETGAGVPVEVTMMRMADGKALRWLLAGSAGHRMWGDEARVTIERNEAARSHEGSYAVRKSLGVDGALALQPTFLYTPRQFWSYLGATKGRHLVAPFGSWRAVAGRSWSGPAAPPTSRRRGDALRDVNRARQEAAAGALADLLPAARPLYESLARELGRPPGRLVFERALVAARVAATRRQVVGLIAALRSPVAAPLSRTARAR